MRKSYWLIPPLLGTAAFFTLREFDRVDTISSTASVVQGKRDDRAGTGVAEAFAGFEQELEELRRAEEAGLVTMGVDDLKLQILALKQKMDGFHSETPWSLVESTEAKIRRAAIELGKRLKQEGLDWIHATSADLARSAMDGIAEVDPDLALALVIASGRQNPCSTGTLMQLLQHQAEQGPAALGKACAAVPWELFYAKDDPFDAGFEIPENAAVAPWIESGAALALAQDGVEIPDFFYRWATHDPAQALSAWEDWPDIGQNSSIFRVSAILHAGQANSEAVSRITDGLERLPPGQLEKLAAKLVAFKQINGPAAAELQRLYPILVPTESEVPE
jgi:hypothetical protein